MLVKDSEDSRSLIVTGNGKIKDVILSALMPGTGFDGVPPEYENVYAELSDDSEPDLPVLVTVRPDRRQLITDAIAYVAAETPVTWQARIPKNKAPGVLESLHINL